ncbi:MAG: 2-oxoglutarate dehydrogenase E1 component [Oligoflexales bacterium]|nr:2-oxoglutarate dehydrogenase E1 component [Oligoflexales bacterium]
MKKEKENFSLGSTSNNERFAFANGANADYIDKLYSEYLIDRNSVEPSWQQFFSGYEFALTDFKSKKSSSGAGANTNSSKSNDSAKVEAFINAYRRLGHLSAHINPLEPKPEIRDFLTPSALDLGHINDEDLFFPANFPENREMKFSEIFQILRETYCGTIGAEFRQINNIEIVKWFQQKMEKCRNKPVFAPSYRQRILNKLAQAEGFEKFLQTRYLGQKRFSIEGLEALIPMLDVLCDEAKSYGAEELNIGMAHRGRLNVLANIMGKSCEKILQEFEDSESEAFDIDGDVKYHMGFANNFETFRNGHMRVYLSPNPSHLEMVNPVVEGFAHCRQRLLNDKDRSLVVPILMHGDAAFIGQGITAETLNLSKLDCYTTGGTIHIITNNQLGFTTDPKDSRSTDYCSALAKIISAPVLHVNADDPEACAWTVQLAVEFRQKFHRDIVIDLVGYRRHGHNETDEPGFTQPLMYKKIAQHPTVFAQYSQKLMAEKVVDQNDIDQLILFYKERLQKAQDNIRDPKNKYKFVPSVPAELEHSLFYRKAERSEIDQAAKTEISSKNLALLAKKLTSLPGSFTPHAKIKRLLEQRLEMLTGDGQVDWGFAELLAFGSLALEGHHVRLSGQDCQRGTFSSRHAVLIDSKTNESFEILNQLAPDQAHVSVINSPLSELGVLGFEFGYSVADSKSLVIWEAQFGDFANGAQIIIDQFLVASEAKWKQACGLVLMLPHGYEGMGPEHSSARPERFLQLCGNLNIQVVNATTPAQHFHVLRRQLHRNFRKPLILMTPKSLLRRAEVVSPVKAFTGDCFHEVLEDGAKIDSKTVTDVILCSGKIYYELKEAREKNPDVAQRPIIRMEQLYPFPAGKINAVLEKYPNLTTINWTQEEPQNMGAWNYIRPRLETVLKKQQNITYIGRKNSGTTAEGSHKAHAKEQNRIILSALGVVCNLNNANHGE